MLFISFLSKNFILSLLVGLFFPPSSIISVNCLVVSNCVWSAKTFAISDFKNSLLGLFLFKIISANFAIELALGAKCSPFNST